MEPSQFTGVITALVTPFRNGEVDLASLVRLVKSQLAGGIEGFVVNGTTAESPTLSSSEVERVFEVVRAEVAGSVPIILGTGSNSTQKTIDATQAAKSLGADAALVVTPYYNKPPQRGLIAHFKAVAESTPDLPILLYNVPGRTITSLSLETIVELSQVDNIVGIKEATGDVEFGKQIIEDCGDNFTVTSGDDATCMQLMLSGGDGVISVVSHVIPQVMVDLSRRALGNDKGAVQDYKHYQDLLSVLYVESNPIPVKTAVKLQGLIESAEMRLPLVELAPEHRQLIQSTMTSLEII